MTFKILQGNCIDQLKTIDASSIQCVVTSTPYWGLRDYGVADQLGLEPTPELYVQNMVDVFREVKRVLRDDGTVWLNLGDSYYNYRPGGVSQAKQTLAKHEGAVVEQSAKRNMRFDGIKEKDLVGIPWLVAFALRADGWYLRSDIIWHKPNPMPESVTDRPTKAHEYIFLLTKNSCYYYDAEAIKEPFADTRMGNPGAYKRTSSKAKGACNDRQDTGFLNNGDGWNVDGTAAARNKRSVWTVSTQPYPGAHFATFPPKLIEPCILAGSKQGDVVLDPFVGSGTTLMVAEDNGRDSIGIELNPEYCELIKQRMNELQPRLFFEGVQ